MEKRRKAIVTTAMAIGALAGAAGLAGAATSATPGAGDATEQEPQLNGSVQATDVDGLSEADESAGLAALATLSEADARAAATGAVPGEVGEVELENENGSVVWSVEVTDASGAAVEVKVDAGNGAILDQQADDDEDHGDDESGESDDGNEAGESGESGSAEVSPAG